jgi:hypothetical protein
MHEHSMVHCDVKPSNVVVPAVQDGRRGYIPTLIDLECATQVGSPIPGYTRKFAARAVVDRSPCEERPAACTAYDMESLLYTAAYMVLPEAGYARHVDMLGDDATAAQFWAVAAEKLKHFELADQGKVRQVQASATTDAWRAFLRAALSSDIVGWTHQRASLFLPRVRTMFGIGSP